MEIKKVIKDKKIILYYDKDTTIDEFRTYYHNLCSKEPEIKNYELILVKKEGS